MSILSTGIAAGNMLTSSASEWTGDVGVATSVDEGISEGAGTYSSGFVSSSLLQPCSSKLEHAFVLNVTLVQVDRVGDDGGPGTGERIRNVLAVQ